MVNPALYQNYHLKIKLHKRIIFDDDFTYRNIIGCIRYFLLKDINVLDIGSATGTLSLYFASKRSNVVGVELSKNAYRYANLNKKNLDIENVKFVNTSIENYKTNKKYDLVTCFEVLEHLEDDLSILIKINSMMRLSSMLAISVPSKNAPLYKLNLLYYFDKRVGHLRRYSLSEIKDKINKSGFKVIQHYKKEGILRNILFTNNFFGQIIKFTKFNSINHLITWLDNIFLKLFGESQIILICKKK